MVGHVNSSRLADEPSEYPEFASHPRVTCLVLLKLDRRQFPFLRCLRFRLPPAV